MEFKERAQGRRGGEGVSKKADEEGFFEVAL